MTKVLLTHTPQARRQYYGERSLSGLQAAAEVVLHQGDDALDAAGLIDAADDVDIIVAAAQSLAFILTLQQVPHAVGDMMLSLSGTHGTWLFMLLSIAVLIVMGSVLEGADRKSVV